MPTIALMLATVAAAFVAASQLHLVASTGLFYLRLDHYENYGGLQSMGVKCDRGSPCDPAFIISVRGSWGIWESGSDCIKDANELNFDDKIGTNLSNPMKFTESGTSLAVKVDIRVKDCHLDAPQNDIGDFYTELTSMPPPFLFTERVDLADRDRARTFDLSHARNAPLSIKMRATVWRQCVQYFYGQDCSKFCKPQRRDSSSFLCDSEGRLYCTGPNCVGGGGGGDGNRGPVAQPTTPQPPQPAVPAAAAASPERESGGSQSGAVDEQQQGSGPLIASLSALLVVAVATAVGVLLALRRCGRPMKRRSYSPNQSLVPLRHSVAVGLRDPATVGAAAAAAAAEEAPQQQDFHNAYYSLQLRQASARQQPPVNHAAACDSGVYEVPEEPRGRELPPPPPLPARDNLPLPPSPPPPQPPPPPPTQQGGGGPQRTPLSKSFSKSCGSKPSGGCNK